MLRRNFVLIIVYSLFMIINLYNYSIKTNEMLNDLDFEYYLTDLDSVTLDKIEKFSQENNIALLINDSNLNENISYVNKVFKKD